MLKRASNSVQSVPLGVGYYTVPEAARLLKIAPRNINRWLGGYTYKGGRMPPLWTPELPAFEDHLEIGFRDLIELRFVNAFLEAGLGLKTIRHCLDYAQDASRTNDPSQPAASKPTVARYSSTACSPPANPSSST